MNKDDKSSLKIFKEMWCSRNPCHEYDPLGNDRFWQTAELVSREYIERISANKPSCSTCGDSGEDRTGENPDEVSPCPDCQLQKQPSDITIDEAREFLLEVNDKHFNDRTFQSYISNRLAGDYGIEIALYIKSQQSRITELQEKLKVMIKLYENYLKWCCETTTCYPAVDYMEYLEVSEALSTIKGEEQP